MFRVIRQSLIVIEPALLTAICPPVNVSPLILTSVTPEFTSMVTEPFVFTPPMTPAIVTMLVADAPDPVVGPVIVVFVGIVNGTGSNTVGGAARLIVFSAAVLLVLNTVEPKLMFPDPDSAANSSASRRLHDASVPTPGSVCSVQLEEFPASSLVVVTTR